MVTGDSADQRISGIWLRPQLTALTFALPCALRRSAFVSRSGEWQATPGIKVSLCTLKNET